MKTFYTIRKVGRNELPADAYATQADAERAAGRIATSHPDQAVFVMKAVAVSKSADAVTTALADDADSGLDSGVIKAMHASDRK